MQKPMIKLVEVTRNEATLRNLPWLPKVWRGYVCEGYGVSSYDSHSAKRAYAKWLCTLYVTNRRAYQTVSSALPSDTLMTCTRLLHP